MSPERDLSYRLSQLHWTGRNCYEGFRVKFCGKWHRPCESGERFIADVLAALDEASAMLDRIAIERERRLPLPS